MAAKEHKVRKRGGKKYPASEKLLALRAVPSSLPEGVQVAEKPLFLRSLRSFGAALVKIKSKISKF